MMPVVRGEARDPASDLPVLARCCSRTTLLLYPVGDMGPIYLAAAVGLGGVFVYRALVAVAPPR